MIAIDLLRIAAGLVVAYHFGAALPLHPSWQVAAMAGAARLPVGAAGWTWFGWVGVELFFVISGLVIAGSARGARPLPFLRRRALRLFPAVWVCASVTLACALVAAPGVPIAPAWAGSMLLLPTAAPVDPSYWTLSLELAFYLLIAAVLTGGGDAARVERAAGWLGVASVSFWVVASVMQATSLAEDFAFQLTLLPHGCFFAAGVLIGARRRWWLIAACLGAGSVEIAAHARVIGTTLGIGGSPTIPVALFLGGVAVIAAAARLQPLLRRAIGERRAARGGAVTYPLYLLHQIAGAAVAALSMRAGCQPLPALMLALGAVVAAACVVAWRVEPAIRAVLGRYTPTGHAGRPIGTATP